MGTIDEKLNYLAETKKQIKDAINSKGVVVNDTDTFRSYATKVGEIKGDMSFNNKSSHILSMLQSVIEEFPSWITEFKGELFCTFANCIKLKRVDFSNIKMTGTSSVTNMNTMCTNCVVLEYLDLSSVNGEKITNMSSAFTGCGVLTYLKLPTNIGKGFLTTMASNYAPYTLNLSSCVSLTHESLMNVINSLYDINSLGVKTQTLILGSTNKGKLTQEELNIVIEKGWNVT